MFAIAPRFTTLTTNVPVRDGERDTRAIPERVSSLFTRSPFSSSRYRPRAVLPSPVTVIRDSWPLTRVT